MQYAFTVVFLDAENGDVIAYLEELPGAHGQGATEDEAEASMIEAAEVILAANRQFTNAGFASGHVRGRRVSRFGRLHVE